MVFLKFFFEKVNFKTYPQTAKKQAKLPSMQKVHKILFLVFVFCGVLLLLAEGFVYVHACFVLFAV